MVVCVHVNVLNLKKRNFVVAVRAGWQAKVMLSDVQDRHVTSDHSADTVGLGISLHCACKCF